MIRPINKDQVSLQQASVPATLSDSSIANDLIDTLKAHDHECVGMAANMINIHKQIIAVSFGPAKIAMLNPKLLVKKLPTKQVRGALVCLVNDLLNVINKSLLNLWICKVKIKHFL